VNYKQRPHIPTKEKQDKWIKPFPYLTPNQLMWARKETQTTQGWGKDWKQRTTPRIQKRKWTLQQGNNMHKHIYCTPTHSTHRTNKI